MKSVPADPYIRDEQGTVVGHYGASGLQGGRGHLRVGTLLTEVWMGREFQGVVVGFVPNATNPCSQVIVRWIH